VSDDQNDQPEESTSKGIFDLFEPPPEIDPNRFGPIPVVPEDGAPPAADVEVEAPTGEASISSIFGFDPIDPDDSDDGSAPALVIDDLADEPVVSGPDVVPVIAVDDDPVGALDEVAAAIPDDSAAEPGSELPHWTAPATGVVPKVIAGDDEAESWASVSGPRWHGEGPQWAGDDLESVFADEDGVGGPKRITIDDDAVPDIPGAAGSPQRPEVAAAARAAQRPVVEVDAGRNVGQAIGAGVAFAAVAVLAFVLGKATTIGLVIVIAVLASIELFGAMRKAGLHPATLLGIVATAALPLAAYHRAEAGVMLVIALSVMASALWYLSGADTQRPAVNVGLTMLGITWIGGFAAFAAFILNSAGGVEVILAVVLITVASDTGAYVGGKAVGSTKFHPASPNKTWEGTIIGVIAAVVAGLIVGIVPISVFGEELVDAALLGLVIGIVVPIGDLTESMVKRDLGVKDMGTLLPGHGGFLDRVDGLLFALPAAYYLGNVLGIL